MKLYAARHGDALDRRADPKRPLSPRGRSEVAQVAAFLEGAGVRVERILHSTKQRAADTALLFAPSILVDGEPEEVDGLRPHDSVEEFADSLAGTTGDLMVVGHLPFMGELVARLAGGTGVWFDTGTVVCLERAGPGHWQIAWMVGPRQMPASPA